MSPKPSEEEKAGCALMCLFMREGEGARTFDAGRKEGRKERVCDSVSAAGKKHHHQGRSLARTKSGLALHLFAFRVRIRGLFHSFEMKMAFVQGLLEASAR